MPRGRGSGACLGRAVAVPAARRRAGGGMSTASYQRALSGGWGGLVLRVPGLGTVLGSRGRRWGRDGGSGLEPEDPFHHPVSQREAEGDEPEDEGHRGDLDDGRVGGGE